MNPARFARGALQDTGLMRPFGRVHALRGTAIEAAGPDVALGDLCRVQRRPLAAGAGHAAGPAVSEDRAVLCEVVGLQPGRVTLMPYGAIDGIGVGCEVQALGPRAWLPVGPALLGRVIDGFGRPLDGGPPPVADARCALHAQPANPMTRPPIEQVLETGIRCIDGLLTLGRGQRIGIFAGSGVGKSSLLGLLARHVAHGADPAAGGAAGAGVNVIALIGERGREVREFVERHLGAEALARSVVVAATADQPALARLRATHAALAIAEHFRAQGAQVLLTVDSITRFAMARREVGLAAGEPPTARGYTPSVFAELPALCERCGTAPGGGSITALWTVLVEGDDFNEPVADALRAVLDGHIVLSRDLAQRGHYPAIDVLASTSRLMPAVADDAERALAADAVARLALLARHRALIDIGAYAAGANAALDAALHTEPALEQWLRQDRPGCPRAEALRTLRQILAGAAS